MKSNEKKKIISIICPVYNEKDCIPIFYKRLTDVINPLKDKYEIQILFLNNSSTDNTLEIILALREKDQSVEVLTYSRNFGYQASVLTGIKKARGEAIVVIDVDCEDPPEMIPQFIEKWQAGYDIVYGIRNKRDEWQGLIWTRKMFYRLLKSLADTDIILDMAEFSLFTTKIRDIIVNNRNTFPFIRADIGYAGFKRYGIEYDRQHRVSGKTKYNLWGMVLFGAGGILSVSTAPMRLAVYFFPLVVLINLILLVLDSLLITNGLYFRLLVTFNLLYIISLISVFGLYIARIYKNGIGRPVTIIDWNRSHFNGDKKE